MIGLPEVEHDVSFPNGVIRNAIVQVMKLPRKVDMLNYSSNMNILVRANKRPELVRPSDVNERQECSPLGAVLKRLCENVGSLQGGLDIIQLHIGSSGNLVKPVDLDTVRETEVPHSRVTTSRQDTNHGVIVLANLENNFFATFPKQESPQYDCRPPGDQSSADRDYMQQSRTQACCAK